MFYRCYKKLKTNKILFSSIIYLGFSLLSQLIYLFYTPILTRNLSQSDYGVYNLLISIEGILSLAFLLCLPSGYSRFYNEERDKKKFENTSLNFLILLGIFSLTIISIFSKELSNIFFKEVDKGNYYIILISLSSYITGLISILTIKYSMEFKAFKISIINLSNIFIQYILLLIILRTDILDINNILLVKIITPGLILVLIFCVNIKNYKLELDYSILKGPLKFGLGMMIGQISTWILTLIDRYFLSGYCGFADVGVYSLAYKIGMLINPVFIDPFRKIFTPLKFKVYNQKNGKEILAKYYNLYCFIGIFVLLGMSIYSKIGVVILSDASYFEAINIIPIVCISYFFWGLNSFYALGVVLGNRSITNSMIAFLAALINILINILLIPKIGMYGAAVSTVVSYLITNELYYKIGKKYYDIDINCLCWLKYLFLFLLSYGLYIVFYKVFDFNIWFEGVINILFLFPYLILSFIFKFISFKEIKGLLKHDI